MPEYGTVPSFFEATPLMIDGVLYVTTPYNSIAALDAETGKELWRFDGEAYKEGQILSASGWKMRGTAFWRDGDKLRILLNSRARLFELDAKTGRPVPTFGQNGQVSLTDGLKRVSDFTHVTQSSPPIIYKDLVIMGSQIPDRVQTADPVGQVQAINARTGKREWVFSVIPQDERDPGAKTWEDESYKRTGHGNVWAPMALDEARGLLYLPTTTPSSDYYGGDRKGANLFAESVVCLDVATGKIKWYFQEVHHGLWDYDNPAPPVLGTVTVNGRKIDFVAQVTKQGFAYVFDRVNGTPLWPIVEKPAPGDSDVPGEKPYPTQPISDQAAGIRRSGRHARRRQRPDPGDQSDGAGRDEEVSSRSTLHPALAARNVAEPVARAVGRAGEAPRSIPTAGTCSCARHIRSAATGWRKTTAPTRWSMRPTRTCSHAAPKK